MNSTATAKAATGPFPIVSPASGRARLLLRKHPQHCRYECNSLTREPSSPTDVTETGDKHALISFIRTAKSPSLLNSWSSIPVLFPSAVIPPWLQATKIARVFSRNHRAGLASSQPRSGLPLHRGWGLRFPHGGRPCSRSRLVLINTGASGQCVCTLAMGDSSCQILHTPT